MTWCSNPALARRSTNGGLGVLNSKISQRRTENGFPFGEETPNELISQSRAFWWSSNGGGLLEGWKSSKGGGHGGWGHGGGKWRRISKSHPTPPLIQPFSSKPVAKPVRPVLGPKYFRSTDLPPETDQNRSSTGNTSVQAEPFR